MIHTIDIKFQGLENTIACYLIKHEEGNMLFETGPHSALENLEAGLQELGVELDSIKHVFLTHIHLDHAGAAWVFAKKGAKIYVHPKGYPHLKDPSRLMSSAKRIYKDQMESLWGDMNSIDEAHLQSLDHEEEKVIAGLKITALHTPGHAKHHIAWQIDNEIICGDVAGVKLLNGPIVAPCPPPDIDIQSWMNSIQIILDQKPSALYLSHFGKIENAEEHLFQLKNVLKEWIEYIRYYFEKGKSIEQVIPKFQKYNDNKIFNASGSQEMVLKYSLANPAWMSVYGLYRYLEKEQQRGLR